MAERSRKLLHTILFIFIVIITTNIAINPKGIFNNVLDSLALWVFRVYPPIFIFYILSSLIISLSFIQKRINNLFKFIKFKSPRARIIFSMSFFLGNPATSALINENIINQHISLEDGNNLLCISSFLNPLFIIAFLTDAFDNSKLTILVLFAHIFSNFILAYFLLRKNTSSTINYQHFHHQPNLIIEIFDSIERANFLLIKVCGIIVASNLCKYGIINLFTYANLNTPFTTILLSLIEVTSGLNDLINLNLSFKLTLSLICFLISFGGFSIHLQVYSIIASSDLSFRRFFIFRILQGIIAGTICFLIISI